MPELNRVLRARISSDQRLAVTVEERMGTYGKYSLGAEIVNLAGKYAFKFGTSMEINV